jgi:hypothetical protein
MPHKIGRVSLWCNSTTNFHPSLAYCPPRLHAGGRPKSCSGLQPQPGEHLIRPNSASVLLLPHSLIISLRAYCLALGPLTTHKACLVAPPSRCHCQPTNRMRIALPAAHLIWLNTMSALLPPLAVLSSVSLKAAAAASLSPTLPKKVALACHASRTSVSPRFSSASCVTQGAAEQDKADKSWVGGNLKEVLGGWLSNDSGCAQVQKGCRCRCAT